MTDFLLYAIICTSIAWLIVNRWKWKRAAKTAQRFNRIQAGVIKQKAVDLAVKTEHIETLQGKLVTELAKNERDAEQEWPTFVE
jgi:Flp pilus assembly protein TadB